MMTQTKIDGKFYPLTPDIARKLRQASLTAAEWRLWSYLIEIDPYGDRYCDLDTLTAMEECQISKTTLWRAMCKFQEGGLFDFQDKGFHFKNETGVSKMKSAFQKRNNHFKNETEISKMKPKVSKLKFSQSETLSQQDFQTSSESKTIQTLHTLSDRSESEKKTEPNQDEQPADSSQNAHPRENHSLIAEGDRTRATSNAFEVGRAVKIKDAVEAKPSAPPLYKDLQQRAFDWLPDGPWMVDGKLDPNFRDAIARDWINRYGGDIHQRRADVLAHFKKDPANLAIRWEQYSSEYLHRFQNAALRMHNGIEIKPDEQQQLMQHTAAVTKQLPQSLNPVASVTNKHSSLIISSPSSESPSLPSSAVAQRPGCFVSPAGGRGLQGGDAGSPHSPSETRPVLRSEETSELCTGSPSPNLPITESGAAENPDAYQAWKPKQLEGEPVQPGQFREKLAALTSQLSMPKPKQVKSHSSEIKSELEELNQWLTDPILRAEVMPRVMNSDRYTVEFDDYGEPLRVVEVQS